VLKDKNLPLKLRFLPHDAKPALTESQLEYFEDAIDVWISRASTACACRKPRFDNIGDEGRREPVAM
jgi:hypothetical protein